jgi:cellulose synthase/poly-beta-1,6-N-acetylglucosamine synthase-like glycosyltransferase
MLPSIALGLLAAVLLLPTVSDLLSLLRILVRGTRRIPAIAAKRPRFLFLVPAHNEELLLASCLESLHRLHYPRELVDVVVIADNCSDRTADIARAAGASCWERSAPDKPGKPRAISWALSQVPVTDYDAVVIVDADSEVDRDFAARLAMSAPLAHKALQPYNGVGNRSANALSRMAAVLSAANHGLAYVLKTRAGLNVPLSVGLCLGSGVLAAHGWTASSICEDWELYALLTEWGVRIEGVPSARIYAQETTTLRASASQRRRWMAGKLTVFFSHAWPLLRSRHASAAQKLDSLAELSSTGPVLHLCVVLLAAAVARYLDPPLSGWLVAAFLATLLRPLVYTCAALRRDPEPAQAILAFAFLPLYAVWRVGVAVTALAMLGDQPWIRTQRDIPSALRQKS